ncbi:hypothetical protein [Psychrobacter sanguinis]|uniref:hypothetical protein n=1 Tax=Psychrobacter sanguinis TaxID=861445 RepID=UPI001919FE77|nr:hypothetical protein [Psychrobacter sanguinis]MCC3344508.1 hypothetical protein [Psychrobacter sanguinis]
MLDLINELIDYEFDYSGETSLVDNAASFVKQKAKDKGIVATGGASSNNLLEEYARIYGKTKAHGALIKAVYKVKIDNVFRHKGNIPWFKDPSLCYLATDASISLGSAESDSYQAGSYQVNHLTQKTSSEFDITFIETARGDISRSYRACQNLAFNQDGTVNETMKYAFKITISLLDPKKPRNVAVEGSWLVGVKAASIEVSATSRSELVQVPVTFEKLRPLSFLS